MSSQLLEKSGFGQQHLSYANVNGFFSGHPGVNEHVSKSMKSTSEDDDDDTNSLTSLPLSENMIRQREEKIRLSPKSVSSEPRKYFVVKSTFKNGPPTVAFALTKKRSQMDAELGADVYQVVLRKKKKDRGLYFRIPPSAVEFNVVKNAFKRAGFKRTSQSRWNMLWGKHMKFHEYAKLNEYQRVNHFPGTFALGRKDNLHRNLSKMRRKFGKAFDFFPKAYLLPDEKPYLLQEMATKSKLYILKPKASSCGRGIKVISHPDQIKRKECLIQHYIANPFLINQRKWDLRIYVVVTSFDPLVVYMFDDGLVRFATAKYNKNKLSNRYSHLTNYSINKNSSHFDRNRDANNNITGSKWSIKGLKQYFQERGIDDTRMWEETKDLIIKTLIAVESSVNCLCKRYINTKTNICFEVFGFDILIDEKFKPWIVEVNVSPSLSSSSPLDKEIKGRLITQTFHMVSCVPYDRSLYEENVEEKKRNRLLGLSKKSSGYKRTIFELKRLASIDYLTDQDRDLMMTLEDQYHRRGDFERIFPTPKSDKYLQYFESDRYNNILLNLWMKEKESSKVSLLNKSPKQSPSKRSKSAQRYRTRTKAFY